MPSGAANQSWHALVAAADLQVVRTRCTRKQLHLHNLILGQSTFQASSAILRAKPVDLGQSRQGNHETLHWLSRVCAPRFSNGQCRRKARRRVHAPGLRQLSHSAETRLEPQQCKPHNCGSFPRSSSRAPSRFPNLPSTSASCQYLGHHSEPRYPLVALWPHNTVISVVHALLEQASMTLPGNV